MIAFEFGILKIYWYGIFYFISFVFGYLFIYFLLRSKYFNNFQNYKNILIKHLDDLILVILIGVLIGGRLAYILIYNLDFYLSNPIKIFFFWEGGMGFVGGVLGVVLGVYYFSKKIGLKKIEYVFTMDLIVSILPFGIMFGRIGNFLNQELFGKPVNLVFNNINGDIFNTLINFKIFYVYESFDSVLRINTNFLESIGEGFLIFLVLILILFFQLNKKVVYAGLISGLFLFLYGLIRFGVEFLRDSSQVEYIGLFTKSQYFMIFFVVFGLYFIFSSKNRKISLS